MQVNKSFKKGEIGDADDFVKRYITARRKHYEMKEYQQIILHSLE